MAPRFTAKGERIGRPPLPMHKRQLPAERNMLKVLAFEHFCEAQTQRILRSFHGQERDSFALYERGNDPRPYSDADGLEWLWAQQREMALGTELNALDQQDDRITVEVRK